MIRTAPAATAAAAVVLTLSLAACDASGPAAGPKPQTSSTTASSTPTLTAAPQDPVTTALTTPVNGTRRAHPRGPYVFKVPADVRRQLFRQDAVPVSFADWIPTSQESVGGAYRGVVVRRRLPPCDDAQNIGYPTDRNVADFADRLFIDDGGHIVARQLTVYADAATAKRAVHDVAATPTMCARYRGKPVARETNGPFAADPGLAVGPVPTLVGRSALSTGAGSGAAWWTVVSRVRNAVVLTRVVAPEAEIDDQGAAVPRTDFAHDVAAQARTSAGALAGFEAH
jgi:hypothetical protein